MFSRRHGLSPRWPEPWIKARTGGSDDHGLFNVGRTWTEFPPEATTVNAILQCIREARCEPGGEAGSSMKLAHNFFGVGIRYYARQLAVPNSVPATMLGFLTGERQPRRKIAAALVKGWAAGMRRKVGRLVTCRKYAEAGTGMLADVVEKSIRTHLQKAPVLRAPHCDRGRHRWPSIRQCLTWCRRSIGTWLRESGDSWRTRCKAAKSPRHSTPFPPSPRTSS